MLTHAALQLSDVPFPPLDRLPIAVGIACTLAALVPQVLRTVRDGRTDGLSPVGLWLGVVVFALWSAYAAATHDAVLLVANLVNVTLAAAILACYLRHTADVVPARVHGAALLAVAMVAASLTTGHGHMLSAVGSGLALVAGLPQLLALTRSSGSQGVAAGSFALGATGAAAWACHWALQGQGVVVASSVYGLAVNLAGLGLLVARAHVARWYRRAVRHLPHPVARPLLLLRHGA